jgi:uncharacterized protein (DUF302 family)
VRLVFALAAFLMVPTVAVGAEPDPGYRVREAPGRFADVIEGVKDAITAGGYVVDYVGHLNTMLERTSETVGSITPTGAKSPYRAAEYVQFCAAKITHEAVSANPLAIANCPYVIFVYELERSPGTIHVGYRTPVRATSMISQRINDRIEKLLDDIAVAALK